MMWVFEYIRLCCYALVAIISFVKMIKYPQKKTTILADIIISCAMFFSVFNIVALGVDKDLSRNWVLTPASVVWAILIYYNFLKK